MARGKSTTTANHVRDPTGQPKGLARSESMRAIDAFSTQRAKREQVCESLHNPSNALMQKRLWRNIDKESAAPVRSDEGDFAGLLRSAT